MSSIFLNTLSAVTQEHISLSRTRRETLCWLVLLIMRYGTVCLWRLAAHAPSCARTDSVRRRFYRFFQFVHIDTCAAARVSVALLGLDGKPWTLTIDRTNWDFGKVSINILMIAVVWNGVGIPLIWTFLPNKGNSSTQVRTQLLERLRVIFPDMKVKMLMGDREFIGGNWMAYLAENNIYFCTAPTRKPVRQPSRLCHLADCTYRTKPKARTIHKAQRLLLSQRWPTLAYCHHAAHVR